ncbi:hypothetical protein [Lacrimispora saccharolytica]|uniref:Uncharacterized protein n=1 Tax=Lacrimispora saccharolytica (strain ATCC 35040 / DSM 2544 / NRCC 2533 / WM1) TaxID=610130 RepID=D9R0D6_LACSW|nr:hypothetical protein [Lacrimispora saccharolytica]ADL06369.1 hypothetical protein Closa_3854 [[Clostridium] saccharolyticum WM1]QRV19536.1 hypothetical protein I6K70_19190 [Lacrimispora saccharolytica]
MENIRMGPCEDGKIVEKHNNIPGFEEHVVPIYCRYELNTSYGVRCRNLSEK